MIVEFSVLDTPYFRIEHLFDNTENLRLVDDFVAGNDASGLEDYLKNQAAEDEKNNNSRTYLVKDVISGDLVGYFSLRTGLITIQVSDDAFDSFPAIELANFAVNKQYKDSHPDATRLGAYMLEHFIYPIARCMAKYVGVNSLYIYALPEDKLIAYYKKMGFSRLPEEQEIFVQHHVKPKYDDGCIFMYQML
ncbi:MAG: hypothetical protein IKQ66_06295 [Treponema sp.]|nr:hypothetical protein [Treponema sp.]MBR6193746.1 hypothetical protein [Treponema sp.]